MVSRAAVRAMGAWMRGWWTKAFRTPSDHALEPTSPYASTQPHKCERATYARPDSGNESEMLWTVLETTKEGRVACCRNTRNDEEGDVRWWGSSKEWATVSASMR